MSTTVHGSPQEFGDEQAFLQLRRRRRTRQDKTDMDITPMIDVVFQLLIYFIVASSLDAVTSVDLPKARYGTPVSGTKAVVLVVTGDAGGPSRVLDEKGAVIAEGDGEQQQEAIAAYVLARLLGQEGEEAKETVLIKAERRLKQHHVGRVIEALGRVKQDFPALEFVYIAVLETK
jgi:biopolymer transport protein ExbD